MQDNPSRVAAAVEQSLNRNATALAHVISPNTKPDPTRTPAALAELSKSVAAYRADLSATRIDITPETGEVGGPKNNPLRWGETSDWSYNGRVTDF